MTDPRHTDPTEPSTGRPGEDEPALPPAAPRRISRYHLRRIIASGGMGTVYEARQDDPRRVVAVKILTRGVTSSSALRRFRQEAQILGRLRHPGIAQVYEAGMYEDPASPGTPVPFFALEYIPNARTLTEYARFRGLDTVGKLELFMQVCEAVHHGHLQGIIHRDLKPGNILVDSAGRVKVIDFGVARTTDADVAVTADATMAGQLVGTLQYMSPEQVEGDPTAIDQRSDIYALGVVLYELLSDRMPYDVLGLPAYEITRVIREHAPTPASSADTSLRGDVDTILQTALQKDPARRYDSVEALRSDIERYLHGQPIQARRDSLLYVTWTLGRRGMARHPVVSMILAAVAATLLAWHAGVTVAYDWTGASPRVERSILTAFGRPDATTPMDTVRVIELTPETDVAALAERAGLADVAWTPNTVRSLRRLHGALMKRLVAARPRLVVWDMYFPGDPDADPDSVDPFTADFLAGVRALAGAGIPVIAGVDVWDPAEMGPGSIHPAIASEVLYGGLGAHMDKDQPWVLNIIVNKEVEEPVPSLVLVARAAAEFPTADVISYALDDDAGRVEARGWRIDPTSPARRRPIGPTLCIELSGVSEWEKEPSMGIDTGDIVGRNLLVMPSDEVLAGATIPYEDVLGASDAQLRAWLGGRAVLLWAGPVGSDRSAHPDGRRLNRYHGQAVGLDMLFGAQALRLPRPDHIVAVLSAAALLGVLVAAVAGLCWWRRVGLLLVIALVALVSSVVVYRSVHYYFDPIVPVIAMIVAAELSAGVLRLRAARRY